MRPSPNTFAVLRQFARRRRSAERCDMCGNELAAEHDHLVEPASRKLICACTACAILFDAERGAKYKRVPRQVRFLNDFQMTDGEWDSLTIPIEMAFFFQSTPVGKMVAFYPSPAGAMESQLSLDAWAEIAQRNPVLKEMSADVTALLACRVRYPGLDSTAEYYLVPIDQCYKLVGLIRTHWRGLSGGTEVWKEIGQFFAELKQRAGWVREGAHA